MVKALLSDTKNVSFPGLKATMSILPHEQRDCHGDVYVRLNPRNRSLINLVCENNPNAPNPAPTSASCCNAIADMMQIRNQTQSALLQPADGCSLFFKEAPEKHTSKPRVPRHEKKEKRANVASMTIEVEHKEATHSIEVLRPIDIRDGLWVKYDADTMGLVVDFLRCSEWKDNQPDEPTGVKGVYKLKEKGFIVHLRTVSNFGPKFKKVATLDDAVAALSEASQAPNADTDKVDDMDETIDVIEVIDQTDEQPTVDSQQSSLVRWMVPIKTPQ